MFIASAGWDAIGAKKFGYPTYWVNRQAQLRSGFRKSIGPVRRQSATMSGTGPLSAPGCHKAWPAAYGIFVRVLLQSVRWRCISSGATYRLWSFSFLVRALRRRWILCSLFASTRFASLVLSTRSSASSIRRDASLNASCDLKRRVVAAGT